MRVLIIGLDAAEYDFIAEGNYPYLKQLEYGKVEINVKPLFTPVIWGSFITGTVLENRGVSGVYKWKNPLLNMLKNKTLGIRLSHKRIDKTFSSIGSFLEKLGLETEPYNRSDLTMPTIFDYFDNHIAISIPSYNEDPINEVLRRRTAVALKTGSRKLAKKTENLAWKAFGETREKVMSLLDGDWNLFMVHFFILDILQHLFWYNKEYLTGMYAEMDKTVKLILDKIPHNDLLLLIVSDHGQKQGVHTTYGYYSSSRKLGLNHPKITDFADVIRSYLGLPSREDEKKVWKHLRNLGYF